MKMRESNRGAEMGHGGVVPARWGTITSFHQRADAGAAGSGRRGRSRELALSTQPTREVKQRKLPGVNVFFTSRHESSRVDGPPDRLPVSGQGHLGGASPPKTHPTHRLPGSGQGPARHDDAISSCL